MGHRVHLGYATRDTSTHSRLVCRWSTSPALKALFGVNGVRRIQVPLENAPQARPLRGHWLVRTVVVQVTSHVYGQRYRLHQRQLVICSPYSCEFVLFRSTRAITAHGAPP